MKDATFKSKEKLADYVYVFWGNSRYNGLRIDRGIARIIAGRVFPQLKQWPRHPEQDKPDMLYGQNWLNQCIEYALAVLDQELTEQENVEVSVDVKELRRR